MNTQLLFTNATDERVMYNGLGIAAHSYLIFDPRLTPPYQVKPLQGFPVRSVEVSETYDDMIRIMTERKDAWLANEAERSERDD